MKRYQPAQSRSLFNKSLKLFMSSYDQPSTSFENESNSGGGDNGIKLYVGSLDFCKYTNLVINMFLISL